MGVLAVMLSYLCSAQWENVSLLYSMQERREG